MKARTAENSHIKPLAKKPSVIWKMGELDNFFSDKTTWGFFSQQAWGVGFLATTGSFSNKNDFLGGESRTPFRTGALILAIIWFGTPGFHFCTFKERFHFTFLGELLQCQANASSAGILRGERPHFWVDHISF